MKTKTWDDESIEQLFDVLEICRNYGVDVSEQIRNQISHETAEAGGNLPHD